MADEVLEGKWSVCGWESKDFVVGGFVVRGVML